VQYQHMLRKAQKVEGSGLPKVRTGETNEAKPSETQCSDGTNSPRATRRQTCQCMVGEAFGEAKSKPKPKRQPLERWEIRLRAQKQERRAMTKPLLKGVGR
jgi:hypothetical protein